MQEKRYRLKEYYQSQAIGNLLDSRKEVIKQFFESLFKFHVWDVKFERIVICEEF